MNLLLSFRVFVLAFLQVVWKHVITKFYSYFLSLIHSSDAAYVVYSGNISMRCINGSYDNRSSYRESDVHEQTVIIPGYGQALK